MDFTNFSHTALSPTVLQRSFLMETVSAPASPRLSERQLQNQAPPPFFGSPGSSQPLLVPASTLTNLSRVQVAPSANATPQGTPGSSPLGIYRKITPGLALPCE